MIKVGLKCLIPPGLMLASIFASQFKSVWFNMYYFISLSAHQSSWHCSKQITRSEEIDKVERVLISTNRNGKKRQKTGQWSMSADPMYSAKVEPFNCLCLPIYSQTVYFL